jgi:hypothetical protein
MMDRSVEAGNRSGRDAVRRCRGSVRGAPRATAAIAASSRGGLRDKGSSMATFSGLPILAGAVGVVAGCERRSEEVVVMPRRRSSRSRPSTSSDPAARCPVAGAVNSGGRAMLKHRGFPGRLPGTDFQFTIRRGNPQGRDAAHPARAHADRKASTAAPTRPSWPRSGTISGPSRSSAATSTRGGSPGSSGAKSFPPKNISTPRATRRSSRIDEDKARAAFPGAFDGTWLA